VQNRIDTLDPSALTIIVPTRNRQQILLKTLDSLVNAIDCIQNLEITSHILVVDDASEIAVQVPSPIQLIRSNESIGESGAINLGLQNSMSRFAIIISDDDPQQLTWLSQLIECAHRNPGFGVYYPNTCDVNELYEPLRVHHAVTYNREIFQSLIRSPVLAGAMIDRTLLPNHMKYQFRLNSKFPSDLIQWLRMSLYVDFFPCSLSTATWVKSDFQNTNRYRSTSASAEFELALIEWWNQEPVPPRIVFGILIRILQFNRFHLISSLQQTLRIIYAMKKKFGLKVTGFTVINFVRLFILYRKEK
jgi:glycosyltransferase involved in cell wall biosynthesis